MENTRDWLSRLLEMIPVRGALDYRCFLGAPWRIDFPASELGETPYHVILGGSAVLEDPAGGKPLLLQTGDILLLPGNPRHVMHDGSGARPKPSVPLRKSNAPYQPLLPLVPTMTSTCAKVPKRRSLPSADRRFRV